VTRHRRRHSAVMAVFTIVFTLGLCVLAGAAPLAGRASAASPARPRPADTDSGPSDSGLRLTVDDMTPRMVTTTGPGTLVLNGSLVNTGTEPVRNVEVRAQLGQRLRTEGDIRTALGGDARDDTVTPGFQRLAAELPPGATVPVRMVVPLRGPASTSLALTHPGVYELLVNVNGRPQDGAQSRLVGVRMLLPVLGLPAAPGSAPAPAPEPAGPARPVSVLYPLADRPHRLPTGPGEPVRLDDEQLADELGRGGRLDGLLAALEGGAPPGSPVHDSLCLAVDPDLLRTVADMAGGYQVPGPDGSFVDGRGAPAATAWLARLRADAAGRCVVALPYADADLVALSRAGLDDLAGYATLEGARIAAGILGAPVRADATWPADGLLDERSLNDYAKAGGHLVVLSDDAVSESGSARSAGGTVRLATPDATTTGVLTDPLVTLAATGEDGAQIGADSYAAALGGPRDSLSPLSTGQNLISPADKGVALSAQDAIGTVAYRAMSSSGSARTLLIAPPHQWDTTGPDARALLDTVGTLVTAGRLAPVPLPSSTGPASGTPASLVYPLRAGAREIPTDVTEQLRGDRDEAAALRSAAVPAQGVGTTPAQVFDPVTQGLLRAASAVWRGYPPLSAAAATVITDRVALLRSMVRVVQPTTPFALGDKEAPLPLTLSNGLPVAMRVRVSLANTPGLKVTQITPDPALTPIPPLGRLQLRASTELSRSGQFSLEARLATPGGAPLGPASRLVLRSTAYGTITLWLTGTAGLLLVILAMRRIIRRLRGGARSDARLAPAAGGPPTPDPVTASAVRTGSGTASGRPTGSATSTGSAIPVAGAPSPATGTGQGTAVPASTATGGSSPVRAPEPATAADPDGPSRTGSTPVSAITPATRRHPEGAGRRLGAAAMAEDAAALRHGPPPRRERQDQRERQDTGPRREPRDPSLREPAPRREPPTVPARPVPPGSVPPAGLVPPSRPGPPPAGPPPAPGPMPPGRVPPPGVPVRGGPPTRSGPPPGANPPLPPGPYRRPGTGRPPVPDQASAPARPVPAGPDPATRQNPTPRNPPARIPSGRPLPPGGPRTPRRIGRTVPPAEVPDPAPRPATRPDGTDGTPGDAADGGTHRRPEQDRTRRPGDQGPGSSTRPVRPTTR
jgi:hypothetical protein